MYIHTAASTVRLCQKNKEISGIKRLQPNPEFHYELERISVLQLSYRKMKPFIW